MIEATHLGCVFFPTGGYAGTTDTGTKNQFLAYTDHIKNVVDI
jgi:hypothetical protein